MPTKRKSKRKLKSPVASPSERSHPPVAAVLTKQRQLVSAEVVEQTIGLKRGTLYRMVRERLVGCYRRGVKKRGLLFDLQEVLASLHQPAATEPRLPMGEEMVKG